MTEHEDTSSRTRPASILAPELILTPRSVLRETSLVIGSDGRISGLLDAAGRAALDVPVQDLPRRAILPGFVNAHSHVFQRLLRGRTHQGFAGRDSFWTWRTQMYGEAERLTPDSLYAVAVLCYREMVGAGYTSVGEFHYVHHARDGTPYGDPLAMAKAIVAAAATVGIRLVLLPVAYGRGGFGVPAEPQQRRFCFAGVQEYLGFVDDLRVALDDAGYTCGLAPHSVRAVPDEWWQPIRRYAASHHLPIHIHASEQVAEVEEAERHHGCTPIALLDRHGLLGPSTTVVHATHATEEDCLLMAGTGTRVCVCPTTEGDLGDGIAPYTLLARHGIALAFGSDGQTRIDPWEEMRWAEFSARMRYQRRRVLTPDAESPGALLLDAATAGGARSLGLRTGDLTMGAWADLVAVDLDHPALETAMPRDLRDTLIFSAGADVIREVWVGGRRVDRRDEGRRQ